MSLKTILLLLWITSQGTSTYEVQVQLDRVSTGTTTFTIDRTGKVTGDMRLDSPNVVEAKLSGTVKDGVWSFEYPFSMPDANCTGIASGEGRVSSDRSQVSGTVTITGGCTPEPVNGTFTFKRK